MLIGTAAAAAAKGLYDVRSAHKTIRKAHARYERARDHYEQAASQYTRACSRTEEGLRVLVQARLDAMVALGEAAVFLRNAHVRAREFDEAQTVSNIRLEQWERSAFGAHHVLTGAAQGLLAGSALSSALLGIAGTAGTASTGTAIATLSGAAATNATLAWLGGGALAAGGSGMALGTAVLGGVVVGPALLVGGLVLGGEAARIKTRVKRQIARMAVAVAAMRREEVRLAAIDERSLEIIRATIALTEALRATLREACLDVVEDVYRVVRAAQALGAVLDLRVVDEPAAERGNAS
jgi:hypothetical protein